MMLYTGLIGFLLVSMNGLLHAKPDWANTLEATLPAIMQQRLLVLVALLLFITAYSTRRGLEQCRKTFLNQLLEFWEFRPSQERRLSARFYEVAHLALIALMFHRALFM